MNDEDSGEDNPYSDSDDELDWLLTFQCQWWRFQSS